MKRTKAVHGKLMRLRKQSGFTLMEALISLALSTVVTSAMVILMGNSMGTATRIIQMSQLSDELRNAVSMMTRDIRRTNYSSESLYCYANPSCTQFGDAYLEVTGAGYSCLIFEMDRDHSIDDADPRGAFRGVDAPNGSGVIQMWISANPDEPVAANCEDDYDGGSWVDITDPDAFDITTFLASDGNSITRSITNNDSGVTVTAQQQEIQVVIEGQVVRDVGAGFAGSAIITRRVEDIIRVRNDQYM